MAGYTMTVQMRAEATNLIRGLRAASREARTLAERTAAANRALAQLASTGTRASRQFTAVGADARRAAAGLNAMATRATSVRGQLRAASRDGVSSIGQLNRAMTTLGRGSSGLTGTAAVTGLALGVGQAAEDGNRYQRQLNVFRAVTSATAAQMQRASWTAQQLGNDLSLPGSTAADAAEGMVELAKAGFRTDQSIDAVRASLALSSAANVSAADSAKYLGDIMDQFGLGADQASRASDILAATANNASGGIIDIYYAMRYAGPVAAGLGVSMEDAASAVGMLGKAGILGQTAGTSLRGMMANLAAPTPQMIAALKRLGIEAWDAQGNFRGLRVVIDGLSKAQHDMSQQDFTGAVKQAFGKPAMSGAIALAHQGTESFDALSLAVRQTGAAASITSARGEGLSGAMVQLNTQARQTGIALYEGMAPGLEYVVRLLTRGLAGATPNLTAALEYGNDLATLFGPDLKKSAADGIGGLVDEARRLIGPLKDIGEDALATGLNLLVNAAQALGDVLGNAADGAAPLLSALGGLGEGGGAAAGTLDILATAANLVIDAVSGLSIVLVPIGHLVGGLVNAFGSLPGPIQSAALAMLLFARARPQLAGLANTVSGPVRGAFNGFAQQMQMQRQLALASGQSLTRYGAAWAAVQARVGFLGQMTSAFRSANGAGTTFIGTLNGVARAAGSGLRSAGAGLVGALGGPWGAALAGVTIGLGFLASQQQKAAQAAAAHQQRVSSLTSALRESGGVIDSNVRAQAAKLLMDAKVQDGEQRLVDVMNRAGVPMRRLTDAYLGQGTSLGALQRELDATAESNVRWLATSKGAATKAYNETGLRAKQAAEALGTVKGEMAQSMKSAKQLAEAQRGAGDGTSAYDRLKTAVGALADETADADQRTRALKDALDLLSGGQISLQAAKARVNSAVLDLNESADTVDRDQGYGGKQLVNKDDTLNTTTRNGQQLYTQLTSLSDAAADAAVSAYSLAQQNGEALPKALAKSRTEMQNAREAAIKAARGYGLTREQAERVADSLGLLPSQVSLLLQTRGMDSTLANLLAVQAEFDRFPTRKTIRIDSLSEGAQKKLRALGFTVKTVPGTRQIKVTAPTAGARKNLDTLIAKLGSTPGSKRVQVSAATAAAIRSLEAVRDKIRSTPGAKSVVVRAPTAAARKQLEALGFRIEKVPGSKRVRITIPTGGPTNAVNTIQSRINALRGRTVGVGVYTTEYYKKVQSGATIPKALRRPNAEGSVLDFYAAGGVRDGREGRTGRGRREDHVAQIAPAGSWRIWGEPETGGEAYVPLASGKRQRSKQIVEEVVRRFDGKVEWLADGGITRRAATAGAGLPATRPRNAAATRALADVVRRFEIRPAAPDARGPATRVDARSGRSVQVVVVREQQPLIGTMPVTVHDSTASPQQIGTEMMRRLRNAQRGGRIR
ncbi:phage tail tape measure protein [Streptomyces luteolus]|uniref:Phage tail tape measure protein n=1 Tax=Streptomyces luteolus TaxID=3043615 RepID=A0ABT6SRJ2_9ACTN|nr:phage tail tape measure protein [Streptomyces sp. B-S-A12]MDI3417980.1 phage tail tape measure protein [Streptomyces sp. B-S-A12]